MRLNRNAWNWALALLLTGLVAGATRAAPAEPSPVDSAVAAAEQLPPALDRPVESPAEPPPAAGADQPLLQNPFLVPLGFTGRSSIVPRNTTGQRFRAGRG